MIPYQEYAGTLTAHERLHDPSYRPVACYLLAATVAATLVAGPAQAAPIGSNTALPLSNNHLILREQLVFSNAEDNLDGQRRQVESIEARTVLGYGLSPKLALFAMAPILQIRQQMGGATTTENGFGDGAAFLRYEVFRNDRAGQTVRIAPYSGLRLPTGQDGRTGDGSVDFFAGVVATVASTAWTLDSELRFDANTEADGFERGDMASFNTSLQLRLAPKQITLDTRGFLNGVLELNASHRGHNRNTGQTDRNSGGFELFVTPGIQYATQRWIADLGVRIPIVNDLNGTALEPDYAVLSSIRFSF